MKEKLIEIRKVVKQELERCIDFWLAHGRDAQHGGVLTCLDREGNVYSTDKSVWMQGRCAWTFSRLAIQYGSQGDWLSFARSCLDFLESHCINRDKGDRLFFQVTRDGKPLRQRRYHFSEAFYAMGNAEFFLATADSSSLSKAQAAYERIWELNHNAYDPVQLGPKIDSDTRKLRSLSLPMIYLNLTHVMRKADPRNEPLYEVRAKRCVDDILKYHRKKDAKLTLETVGINGEYDASVSTYRVLNPGHAIECSWFLMDEAQLSNDDELLEEANQIFLDAISAGWDEEYGGILYFLDAEGWPPEAYEHDMKLWWPHNEALIASLKAFNSTNDNVYFEWFSKLWEYTYSKFPDPEYGEWFGYLRRDGQPTWPAAKGSTFKGPFHVPRMLMILDDLLAKQTG